jgi:F0F1-type ATP synthase assembly protein I
MDQNLDQKPNTSPKPNKWSLVAFALDMGFVIALPLVVAAFLGKWLDSHFGTKPWLTLAGIIIAVIITAIWMTKKLRTYIK